MFWSLFIVYLHLIIYNKALKTHGQLNDKTNVFAQREHLHLSALLLRVSIVNTNYVLGPSQWNLLDQVYVYFFSVLM